MSDDSRADVVLVSCPNRNIDYPGLALPTLVGALSASGFSTRVIDFNVQLRHRLISADVLSVLDNVVLPGVARTLQSHPTMQERALLLCRWLRALRDVGVSPSEIERAKRAMCNREYAELLKTDSGFRACLSVFQVSRCLNNILDLYVASPWCFSAHDMPDPIGEEIEECLAVVARARPHLVGFTILDIQRPFSLYLAQRLRSGLSVPIVVGGADPTKFPETYLRASRAIDFVLVREAEATLPALVEEVLSKRRHIRAIPNLYFRDGERIVRTQPRGAPGVPSAKPDHAALPLHLYLVPALPVQASRGCEWARCKFCVHWKTYSRFERRSVQDVVAEIVSASAEHGVELFHFTDDALPPDLGVEIADRLVLEAPHVRWLAYARADATMRAEVLARWYAGGCRVVEWGFETASDRLLKSMDKGVTTTGALANIDAAAQAGILNKLFAFHGYPGETLADLEETLRTLARLGGQGVIRFFFPVRNRLELLTGSRLFDEAQRKSQPYGAVRFPRGQFSIRAEFRLDDDADYAAKRGLLGRFAAKMRRQQLAAGIYSTDDENVTLDLLVIRLREAGVSLALECDQRCAGQ